MWFIVLVKKQSDTRQASLETGRKNNQDKLNPQVQINQQQQSQWSYGVSGHEVQFPAVITGWGLAVVQSAGSAGQWTVVHHHVEQMCPSQRQWAPT